MSSYNLLTWGLTAVSIAIGVGAAFASGDWTWFARSGAAVVAVGVVLTSHQVFEHNRRLIGYQRRQRGHRGQPYDTHAHDWANENSIHQLIRARSHEEENWRREFSGFHMLVGGTLIWGFGDLLGLLFV